MTYDNEVTLIGAASYTKDDIGNQIPVVEETTILCGRKSVSQNEFYSAAQDGIKPEIKLVIHPYEYNGQKKFRFANVLYKLIRTFDIDSEDMEITGERD